MGTLLPKPPPTSGEMMRMRCSGKPATIAKSVGCLRGHPDGQLAGGSVIVSHTTAGLDGSGMDTRDVHILTDYDPVGLGLGKGCVGARPVAGFPVINVVGWLAILLVGAQQRRVWIKRFLGVYEHRQRFVIDLDSRHTIGCCVAAGGYDKGHFLHLVMYAIQCQHCLGVVRER